jgi:NAD(P)-dependent dehydrogenase (short-subunit alcohol dehydrogenase family)
MDLSLQGKLALVTGSTAGIGFAIAERLAREGAQVVLNGRSEARVAEACATLQKKLPEAKLVGIAADVGTEQGVRRIVERFPDLDVLINNAGIFAPRTLAELSTQDWQDMYTVNVLSGARLSQHYLPRMLTKNAGRIVFISSESALQIPAEMIHYGVSKAAQAALARGLAELTRKTAVTVNTVLAGPTFSEGVATFVGELASQAGKSTAEMEREFFQTMRPSSLLQRFATPDEIANVVVFLTSPLAAAVSGAAVRAEGGLLKGVY